MGLRGTLLLPASPTAAAFPNDDDDDSRNDYVVDYGNWANEGWRLKNLQNQQVAVSAELPHSFSFGSQINKHLMKENTLYFG